MTTFWFIFHHDRKIGPAWWGYGVHAHPLSLYLPSRTKLQCTLQLRGQIQPPVSILPLCVLCGATSHTERRKSQRIRGGYSACHSWQGRTGAGGGGNPDNKFVNVYGAQESIPGINSASLADWYDKQGYRTGPPGYIGWRNRFFEIDSWAPWTFTNSGSADHRFYEATPPPPPPPPTPASQESTK